LEGNKKEARCHCGCCGTEFKTGEEWKKHSQTPEHKEKAKKEWNDLARTGEETAKRISEFEEAIKRFQMKKETIKCKLK